MEKTHSLIENLRSCKCYVCGLFLSVPPITTAGPINEFHKCGRCQLIQPKAHPSSTRNRVYEEILEGMSFPCCYPECGEMIVWSMVGEHERSCRHRIFKCQALVELSWPWPSCSITMRLNELKKHFEDIHNDYIITMGTPFIKNKSSVVYLMQVEDQYFYVYILMDYKVAVLAVGRNRYSKFNIKVARDSNKDCSIFFEGLPVVNFDERIHCFQCVIASCDQSSHTFSNEGKRIYGDPRNSYFKNLINKDTENLFGTFSLSWTITLVPDETRTNQAAENEESAAVLEKTSVQMNAEILRTSLSCPYCLTYMESPIYTCPTGHTVCKTCKARLTNCPTCTDPLGECRNYTLEKMAEELQVFCQYYSKGCMFISNTAELNIHEQECSFKDTGE